MYMVERVAKAEFPKGVKHKPLRLSPSKNLRLPSLRANAEAGPE
jgi:hypothetical protein